MVIRELEFMRKRMEMLAASTPTISIRSPNPEQPPYYVKYHQSSDISPIVLQDKTLDLALQETQRKPQEE